MTGIHGRGEKEISNVALKQKAPGFFFLHAGIIPNLIIYGEELFFETCSFNAINGKYQGKPKSSQMQSGIFIYTGCTSHVPYGLSYLFNVLYSSF